MGHGRPIERDCRRRTGDRTRCSLSPLSGVRSQTTEDRTCLLNSGPPHPGPLPTVEGEGARARSPGARIRASGRKAKRRRLPSSPVVHASGTRVSERQHRGRDRKRRRAPGRHPTPVPEPGGRGDAKAAPPTVAAAPPVSLRHRPSRGSVSGSPTARCRGETGYRTSRPPKPRPPGPSSRRNGRSIVSRKDRHSRNGDSGGRRPGPGAAKGPGGLAAIASRAHQSFTRAATPTSAFSPPPARRTPRSPGGWRN